MIANDVSAGLRRDYLKEFEGSRRLIGISWRGGGRGSRINKNQFHLIFQKIFLDEPGVIYISLQYGKVQEHIANWRKEGYRVLSDPRVDAIKDMDLWLAQVDACDAVVSVANTTIHGAGGLNKPTQCLLSRYADWRWLDNSEVPRSYWYPSVGIQQEHKELGWDRCIQNVRDWQQAMCPYPTGPAYSV